MDLRKGDCLKILKDVEDKSISLFLLDLPYGQTSCKWDTIIDLKEMWVQIKRTMTPTAIMVFFCTTKFGYKLIQSNEKWFRYDLIWEKSKKVGFLSANKMPLRKHENIYIFKPKSGTYHPQMTEGTPYKKRDNDLKNTYYRGGVKSYTSTGKDNTGERHPTSVLGEFEEDEIPTHESLYVFKPKQGTYNPQKEQGEPYKKVRPAHGTTVYGKAGASTTDNKSGDRHPTSVLPGFDLQTTILKHNNPHKSVHRTQKPVSLCEWLIKTYSNEGELVCDFCMGSGTVGVACKKTNRRFLGVEMDDEIFEIARQRIETE